MITPKQLSKKVNFIVSSLLIINEDVSMNPNHIKYFYDKILDIKYV